MEKAGTEKQGLHLPMQKLKRVTRTERKQNSSLHKMQGAWEEDPGLLDSMGRKTVVLDAEILQCSPVDDYSLHK